MTVAFNTPFKLPVKWKTAESLKVPYHSMQTASVDVSSKAAVLLHCNQFKGNKGQSEGFIRFTMRMHVVLVLWHMYRIVSDPYLLKPMSDYENISQIFVTQGNPLWRNIRFLEI